MNLVSESLNELYNFEKKSDSLSSLGIGKKALIEKWLKEHSLYKYKINDDFSINLPEASGIDFVSIPNYINFNEIMGSLWAYNLNSLKGFPLVVNGNITYRGNVSEKDIINYCNVTGTIIKI